MNTTIASRLSVFFSTIGFLASLTAAVLFIVDRASAQPVPPAVTQHDVYWRNAQITNVVDGDTLDAFIDLGYNAYTQQRGRLLEVDTPELNSRDLTVRQKAREARDYVEGWVATYCVGSRFPAQIRSEKDDSFGRYLMHVECSGQSLNQDLLDTGHAVRYE